MPFSQRTPPPLPKKPRKEFTGRFVPALLLSVARAVVARWLKPGGQLLIVHWDGREKLAAIHASHHSVAADVFPPRAHLESAFVRHGFALRTWIETPEEIFIETAR